MDARARLALAARDELISRLSASAAAPWQPGVAEAAMEDPGPQGPRPQDLAALGDLAEHMVEAVLALAGSDLDPAQAAQALSLAARERLGRTEVDPARRRGMAARLAGEIPRLLNLPLLLRLARQGLTLEAAALVQDQATPELVAGRSAVFTQVLRDLELVSGTDFPVLLLGETGTGKELLARRLHQLSPRREGPFVPVNCAALPKGLLESALFGHVKGAFTGAHAPQGGYLRAAHGGTLFLDEIGETTPEFQVRLLRVLEDQVVVPVGSVSGRRVDFRLVTASSRDLELAAQEGRFNQALLYRILVVPIRLPALRARPEDLPDLLEHFLGQACLLARRTRGLSPELVSALTAYAWPGNVRELSHLMQRLVALSAGYQIGLEDLPPELAATLGPGPGPEPDLAPVPGVGAARMAQLTSLLAGAPGREIMNRDLRKLLGCSDSTAKNILRSLVEAGLLEVIGERGGRRYRVLPQKKEDS